MRIKFAIKRRAAERESLQFRLCEHFCVMHDSLDLLKDHVNRQTITRTSAISDVDVVAYQKETDNIELI